MASPIKLAHALKTVREEAPQTCLAAEEMGDGILVPSRLYMYMNKSDGKTSTHTHGPASYTAPRDCRGHALLT